MNEVLSQIKFFMVRKILLIATFVISLNDAYSQTENRATLNYIFYNRSNSENLHHLDQSNVDFNYFLKSKTIFKKVRWDNSFAYRTVFLEGSLNPNLQDLEYKSNFVYTKNMKNFLIGSVRFNMRSELQENIAGNSLFPSVSFGYMRQSQTNKSIRWAIGLNYNNDFNRNAVIPFAIFNYETAKYRFNATLPNSVLYLVKHKPTFLYGLNATLNASIFELQNERTAYLQAINANVAAFAQIKLKNKLWLDIKPGYTLLRRIDLLDANFERPNAAGFQNTLTNNFVMNVGLLYRM